MIIVFEGIDGSGKGTQSRKLSEYYTQKGVENALYSFPNYTGTNFGHDIGKYLNGAFGKLDALPAQFPAMLYALDRFEMKTRITADIDSGKIIIFDRYVPSNLAHQAAKLPEMERAPFIDWVKRLEYNILGMPEPDRVVFLDTLPDVAGGMVLKKDTRTYTTDAKDIHERDERYMVKVYSQYKSLSESEGWLRVVCTDGGIMRSVDDIFSDVISLLNNSFR